jgi:5-dehydro-2-deoxygluconokinase
VAAIEGNDPHTRGIVVLGLDAPADELAHSFRPAAAQPLVKGFAVGRTIFGAPARDWFAGRLDDAGAVAQMAKAYAALCGVWDRARQGGG